MSRLFRPRPLAGLAALVGMGLLAAGCSGGGGGGGGSAAPGGLEKTNLNVAALPSVDSAALYIAADRGLFAAEGLRVTIQKTQTEAAIIGSQLKGNFDVTAGPYVSYIRQNASDPKASFRVLAPGSVIQPSNEEILVPKDSSITTIGGLANAKIAVDGTSSPGGTSTIGTLLVSSVLADNAIQAKASQFVAVPFGDMASAMAQGRVGAAWVPEPYLTEAEEKTGAVPLADPNQGSSQNLPISGYMVTASWLKKYPNTAAAFRTAILKAQAIAATDPGAVERGMEKFAGTQQEMAAIASDPEFPTQQNPVLLQRLADLMLTFGMLPQRYNVDQMIAK